MSQQYITRPDTRAWVFQVWSAFTMSVLLCGVGVWNLPNTGLDRAFLTIGFFFCVFSSLTLAKTIRDNRDEKVDTDMWALNVWIAFAVALTFTGWGLVRMELDIWKKGYIITSALFLVSSTFVLAKTIRDNHEAAILNALPANQPEQ